MGETEDPEWQTEILGEGRIAGVRGRVGGPRRRRDPGRSRDPPPLNALPAPFLLPPLPAHPCPSDPALQCLGAPGGTTALLPPKRQNGSI